MKHIIIGTAGHIDHGKTTLIKAITGRNTDRLKEEQKRGISIDLGFTYFDLPSGQRAGIIDVPGHEKFIKNMLAGVMGMDIVLLVVAADEGIMPQTLEHLSILNLLGIKRGFVVVTKVDLVDNEWLKLVEEEIEEEIKGTFLENSPILRVSSINKEGINDVINLIDQSVKDIEDRDISDIARIPVDRVFTMSGFGTVITGTLLSGQLKVGQDIQIYPGNHIARIRTLQVHDQDTEVAYGGQRVAVNLAGVKKESISRGNVIAPIDQMKVTRMLDVKVKLLDNIDLLIKSRTRLRLYLGSKELFCRIVLLDKEVLEPGQEAYAQLRLEEEVVAKREDRFIIRFYSPMFTIGGGIVLEAYPNKKKPLDKYDLDELRLKEEGNQEQILEKIIYDKSPDFLTVKEFASITAILEDILLDQVKSLEIKAKVIIFNLTKDIYVIHKDYYNNLKKEIIKEIDNFHKKYPLRPGISKEVIRRKFLKNARPRVGETFIQRLIDQGHLGQDLDLIRLKDFKIEFNDQQLEIKDHIIENYKKNSYMIPKLEDMISTSKYKKDDFLEVFNLLVSNKVILTLDDEIFILEDLYKKSIDIMKAHIEKNGAITVGEFRDLLNTNRRITLLLLESFDLSGITKRQEDKRVLTND